MKAKRLWAARRGYNGKAMPLTRRESCRLCLVLAGAPPTVRTGSENWTLEWDHALVAAAVERLDESFDPQESMLARRLGADYHYHTSLRGRVVHLTRESLDYALLLLEAGGDERRQRAAQIIQRVVALQEVDGQSKWYGIWGYYLEEPAPQMSPADWNWADFNGALLLLIEGRHGSRLPDWLRRAVRQSIRHAAYSVRRRNVPMTYTNIAVQGTFVTLAAGELLEDQELESYALERLHRFAGTVDQTGSFAEYNSPTYAQVTIANLVRIRMLVKNLGALALADHIHHRAWLHLGKRWHLPTRQLAGPMSRCYQTDTGAPVWIQKALRGRLSFVSLEDLRQKRVSVPGEVGILDHRCPSDLTPLFLRPVGARQHREWFLPAEPPVRPVHGTTWLESAFCLGSVNRSDLWIQRRPLLAYWGGAQRPACYLQLRFLKDDYDFASALFYSAQERNFVLGLVSFRSPGGDKHGSLDPIQNGEFTASRLRVRFDLSGVPEGARILAHGQPITKLAEELPVETALALDLGGARLWLRPRAAVFGDRPGRLSLTREDSLLTISLDLMRSPQPVLVKWKQVPTAYAAFTLALEAGRGKLDDFHLRASVCAFQQQAGAGATRLFWNTPAGTLAVQGGTRVTTVAEQDRIFLDTLNGEPVPLVRLSQEKLFP